MSDLTDRQSKTRVKQEMLRLQKLGESLIDLPDSELDEIGIPERLHDAIRLARRTTKRGALYRQRQFIGRLMREIDSESIDEYMQQREGRSRADTARLHRCEQWRDRLIEEGDEALPALLELHSQADRQHLRQLIRGARQEREREAAPSSARKLFRYLADLLE